MERYSKEIRRKTYDALPLAVKEILNDDDWIDAYKKIASASGLHIDQLDKLSQEIDYVMLGLERPTAFLRNIQTELGVSSEAANSITKMANELIFQPLQTQLKTNEEEAVANKAAEAAPVATVTTAGRDILDKERIIEEIENPVPSPAIKKDVAATVDEPVVPTTDPYHERLESAVSIPRQEKKISDPYHEPLE